MLTEEKIDSVREERAEERRWISAQRRYRLLRAAVIVLTAVIAGLVWYTYPLLKSQNSTLAKLPGIESLVGTLSSDFRTADAKLTELFTNNENLRQQVDKLGREVRSRLDSAKKQAGDATTAMAQRIEGETSAQVNGLRTRVDGLEASRANDQSRIASLQQELNQVRGELAHQSEELASTRRQMEGNSANTDQRLSSLTQSQQRDRKDVDQIANNLAVERVGFEVSKGHSTELVPGISLGVTGTNTQYRRVTGWMWLGSDRRTIWLRGQSVQEPLVFYDLQQGKRHELVITHVAKNSVVGYLIEPKTAPAASAPTTTGD